MSKTTLEPKITPRTTPEVPKTFPNVGHSISSISRATPLNKLSSSFSFLSAIAFFSSDANSAFDSASGSGSEPSWLSSTTPATGTRRLSGSSDIPMEVRGRGLKRTEAVSVGRKEWGGNHGKCELDVSGERRWWKACTAINN